MDVVCELVEEDFADVEVGARSFKVVREEPERDLLPCVLVEAEERRLWCGIKSARVQQQPDPS